MHKFASAQGIQNANFRICTYQKTSNDIIAGNGMISEIFFEIVTNKRLHLLFNLDHLILHLEPSLMSGSAPAIFVPYSADRGRVSAKGVFRIVYTT